MKNDEQTLYDLLVSAELLRSPRHKEAWKLLEEHGPLTGDELNDVASKSLTDGKRINSLHTYLRDMLRTGLVRRVEKRACRVTGQKKNVWRVVDSMPEKHYASRALDAAAQISESVKVVDLALKTGLTELTIYKANTILKKCVSEVADAIRDGTVQFDKAYMLKDLSPEKQRQRIEHERQSVDLDKGRSRKKVGRIVVRYSDYNKLLRALRSIEQITNQPLELQTPLSLRKHVKESIDVLTQLTRQ